MHFVLVMTNMKSKKEACITANFLYQRFMLSEIKSKKIVIAQLDTLTFRLFNKCLSKITMKHSR